MKISIRSSRSQKNVCEIDAEPGDLIAAIKRKIQESQGLAPSSQRIIFSGRVIQDDETLELYDFREETDYLVLLVAKPKPAPTPIPSPSTPAGAAHRSATATGALSNTVSSSTDERSDKLSHATSPAGPSPPASASEIHPVSPSPSAAIAYMPTTAASPVAAVPASSDASSAPTLVSPAPGVSTHALVDTSFHPDGEALQSTISNMVDMGFERDQVLRALRASYNNPDRAVEYLTTEIPAHLETDADSDPAPVVGEGDSLTGAQTINLTREDEAAVERLETLGFPRPAVIEAYFACDKNEELAVNYLVENGVEF